jgi:hypothetical protein
MVASLQIRTDLQRHHPLAPEHQLIQDEDL